MNMTHFRPTTARVDLTAIQKNIEGLRNHLHTDAEIIAVVKANAYGHGDVEVSKAAIEAGVTMLAVATPDEALHLREVLSETPILVLGAVPISFVPFAAKEHITLTVFSMDWLEAASEQFSTLDVPVKVHMKIDSGMGRIGVRNEHEMLTLYHGIQSSPQFELDGIFTHFATADEEDSTYYDQQKDVFIHLVNQLPTKPRLVHAANTAASLLKNHVEFDAVRFGISMYGLLPSTYVGEHLPFTIHPALQLETEIVHVKQLKKGEHVGYGATYEAQEDGEWIATLPIGYADGVLRGLQGQEVLVGGIRVPIVGRICMDQLMIRLPFHFPVGEKVVLIGKQEKEQITMQEWADRLHTIPYEVACILTARVPRVYYK
ncbi:alanine racemase [Kurthia gibsonii]|nr:alanine racemase [Kurthia gibsonii]RXH52100.1 alanine racemase [Kurthia gibsonii]